MMSWCENTTRNCLKNINIPYTSDLTLYKPEGCDMCNNTGYHDA
ncbi:MAG: hypothetical protein R2860_06120 [Desulfobacterales bacterium]